MEPASLVLPLPSCVTMDMLLNLSGLLFSDLPSESRGATPRLWKQ